MMKETFSHFIQALNVDLLELTRKGVRIPLPCGKNTIIDGDTQALVLNKNWQIVSSPMSIELYYSPDGGVTPHTSVSSLAYIDLENTSS
jgi:hypothetical protein